MPPFASALGPDDRWDVMLEDDPRRYVHDIYQWLGWLQETLVRAVASRLR